MDLVSFETFDASVDEALLQELTEGDEITFVEFQGSVKVIEKR
jgi:translation elongation factor P/translation initiation factor 5A